MALPIGGGVGAADRQWRRPPLGSRVARYAGPHV